MAVSILGSFVEANGAEASASATVSHTLAAGNNRIVILTLPSRDLTPDNISTVTYGGVACTLAVKEDAAGGGMATYLYYILEASLPADGANDAVVTFNGNIERPNVGCICIQDAFQTAPEATGTDSGSDASASITLSISANSFQIDCFSHLGGAATLTWGADQIERWDEEAGATCRVGCSTQVGAGSGSETLTVTSAGANSHSYCVASFQAISGFIPKTGGMF